MPAMPPDPAGRRAIVTGASSGIGKSIAERLLDDGWSVVGVSRSKPAIAHPRFHSVPLDLAAGDATAAALLELPPALALVHAAGLLRVGGSANRTRATAR